jgi:hypothetical protein
MTDFLTSWPFFIILMGILAFLNSLDIKSSKRFTYYSLTEKKSFLRDENHHTSIPKYLMFWGAAYVVLVTVFFFVPGLAVTTVAMFIPVIGLLVHENFRVEANRRETQIEYLDGMVAAGVPEDATAIYQYLASKRLYPVVRPDGKTFSILMFDWINAPVPPKDENGNFAVDAMQDVLFQIWELAQTKNFPA